MFQRCNHQVWSFDILLDRKRNECLDLTSVPKKERERKKIINEYTTKLRIEREKFQRNLKQFFEWRNEHGGKEEVRRRERI